MAQYVQPIEIIRVATNNRERVPDLVAAEEPLEIRIGYGRLGVRQQRSLSVTMRTPGHDVELALGFLFTEGIVQSYDQVESAKHCEDVGHAEEAENIVRIELKPEVNFDVEKFHRNFYTTSSCGVCGKSSIEAVTVQCPKLLADWQVSESLLHALPAKLREAQRVFEYTGALHASGLFDRSGELALLREDVGRHNALDKMVGAMLLKNGLPLSDAILLVSGRTSFELVQKAAMSGIPLLAAIGAPSSLAVRLARECSITLVGFLRDGTFNVYTGEERIAHG